MIACIVASLLAAAAPPSVGEGVTGAHVTTAEAQAPGKASPGSPATEAQKSLEEDIAREMGGASSAPASPPAPPAGGASAQTGSNPLARLAMLPDISAIGNFAMAWNDLDVEQVSPRGDLYAPAHTVQPIFQELELGLQAVVDPYARADAFISFSGDGAEVEEAYLTTLSLPFSLQARAGKFHSPFGRVNQQHAHSWDFIDRPLALARLVGSDGLGGTGLDLAWLAPTPWFAEFHLAYQSVTPAFEETAHNGGVARLLQYFDLGDAAVLGVGVSAARLDEGGSAYRDLLGGDFYLKLRPPDTRAYLALQGEAVACRLSELADGSEIGVNGTEWGGYLQALWRASAFWAYGVRYERAPAQEGGPENRASALASWMVSEFQRIRLQVSYDRLPGGLDGLEALLHLEFIIGSHGAHPF